MRFEQTTREIESIRRELNELETLIAGSRAPSGVSQTPGVLIASYAEKVTVAAVRLVTVATRDAAKEASA